jgi:hypothetical protein
MIWIPACAGMTEAKNHGSPQQPVLPKDGIMSNT